MPAFVYLGYENHWLGLGSSRDPVDRSATRDGRVNDARSALLKYLTGYVVEMSLSVDNVFVIAMMFGYFAIPRIYQHRVLFWGILGALVMRGAMIAIGARLIAEFSWILYVFGALLILTAVKMLFMKTETADPQQNVVVRLIRRFLPVTDRFHGEHFFVEAGTCARARVPGAGRQDAAAIGRGSARHVDADAAGARAGHGRDDRPRVRGRLDPGHLRDHRRPVPGLHEQRVRDPRPALALLRARRCVHLFRYLKVSLALVLVMVGVKMLAHSWLERVLGPDFNLYLLAAVLVILGAGVVVSLIELKWHDPISRATRPRSRRLQQWIVPDRLTTTILRAGRRELAQRTAAGRRRAQRSVTRPSRAGLWNRLFRGKGRGLPILVVYQVIEEGGMLAAFL